MARVEDFLWRGGRGGVVMGAVLGGLACGGFGGAPAVEVPPDGLECLAEVASRAPGSLAGMHGAAQEAHALRADRDEVLELLCDPSTDRLRTGYAVNAYAEDLARDDPYAAFVVFEWNALNLGNPASAVRAAAILGKGGRDGRPKRDRVRAAGLHEAAMDIQTRLVAAEGRGKASDLLKMPAMRAQDSFKPEQERIDAARGEVLLVRSAVIHAFDRSLGE